MVLGLLLIAFFGAFVFTGKATYHMFHVVTNITGKYADSSAFPIVSQVNLSQTSFALGYTITGKWCVGLLFS